MISPAVMFIEMAADSLIKVQDADANDQWLRDSQAKELRSFGDLRAQQLGATGLSDDFKLGYALGIETARTILKGMPAAIRAGVEL